MDKSEKKSRWRLTPPLPQKDHLWPPKEWPKDPWFVELYFYMLSSILIILGFSFFYFMVRGGDVVSKDSSMEVTIGITVGMFGILTTFAVVFFAFRAEETAVSKASETAKLFSEQAFFDKEEEALKMLRSKSGHDSKSKRKEESESKPESIYKDVDTPGWQLFAWGAVFSLFLFHLSRRLSSFFLKFYRAD